MRYPRVVTAVAAAFLAGCAARHAPETYRLTVQGRGQVLVPPGVATAEVAQRIFIVDVARGKGKCEPEGDAVLVQPKGRRVRVTVNREALLRQPSGWLSGWAARAEASGCILTGDGGKLANGILESVPMDASAAFRLLHGNNIANGYVDLGPENRLEVVSPILADESAPVTYETTSVKAAGGGLEVGLKTSSNVLGFETAWYGLQTTPGGKIYRFTPLGADRNLQGKTEHRDAPAANYFQFPPEAGFYRLYYKTDHNEVTAIVIAGATRDDLEKRTKAVAGDPNACQSPMCLTLPRRTAANPFLVVNVNGADVTLPVAARVRSIFEKPRAPRLTALPAGLTVLKPYGGRLAPVEFDPSKMEILDLTLLGGERISYRPM